MPQRFRLFWLRETGCDAGTPIRAVELEPEIRQRVLALAGPVGKGNAIEIAVRLPYMDQREWNTRGKILAALPLERNGDVISFVASPAVALRDAAATLVLTDPVWLDAPSVGHADYFPVWRTVSMTLQSSLRDWIPEKYFRNIELYENRRKAASMLVYQAARVSHGRAGSEFTYSFQDFPACRLTLALSLKLNGRNLRAVLETVEERLSDSGMLELARRYAPVWHKDLVALARKRPKPFLALLGAESAFINALMELNLDRTPNGIQSFSKAANRALRNVYGMDLRPMGVRALELVTEVLATAGRAYSA